MLKSIREIIASLIGAVLMEENRQDKARSYKTGKAFYQKQVENMEESLQRAIRDRDAHESREATAQLVARNARLSEVRTLAELQDARIKIQHLETKVKSMAQDPVLLDRIACLQAHNERLQKELDAHHSPRFHQRPFVTCSLCAELLEEDGTCPSCGTGNTYSEYLASRVWTLEECIEVMTDRQMDHQAADFVRDIWNQHGGTGTVSGHLLASWLGY